MESSNPHTTAKRLWHIVKIVCYVLRKGMAKRKLVFDLQLLLKRSKLAGKAIRNLLMSFHHHHHHHHSRANPNEVEFSCSNTPSHASYFHSTAGRKSRRHRRDEFDIFDPAEIAMALQMMNEDDSDGESAAPSALPTPSPAMVRQLRITDSPFPIDEKEAVDVGMIDKEAEKFIKRFYEQLLRQQLASGGGATTDYGYGRRPIAGRS